MSAPKTNIEKQKRHHRFPLIGMAAVVIVLIAFVVWFWAPGNSRCTNIIPTPAVPVTMCSGCATYWASDSSRDCATLRIASLAPFWHHHPIGASNV